MKPIQTIVINYRKSRKLSLRAFASALVEKTTGESITHQSIKNWEDGTATPNYGFLMMLAMRCRDWRGDFAFDCLAARNPAIYEPISEIGRQAIATPEA